MKLKIGLFLSIIVAIIIFQSWQSRPLFELVSGQVAFESDAPLELIKAESKDLKGLINPSTREFAFTVAIRTFEGFNSPLQREHFNENYLESSTYTRSSYSGKIIEEIDLTKDGTLQVRTKGILNIHGVKQERIIKCEVRVANGKLNVNANFTISLKDHDIPIPKIVNQKIAEDIKVNVEAVFEMQKNN